MEGGGSHIRRMEGAFFRQDGGDLFGFGPGGPGAGSESDPEDGSGDPGLTLGDDILTVRRHAVEAKAKEAQKQRAAWLLSERLGGQPAGPGGPPAEPSGPLTFAANLAERRREQIDLNAGAALSHLRLEDPMLATHMNTRRELAAAEAVKGERPPPLGSLRAENKEASRGLSTVTLSLKEANMALRCAIEEVLLEADNAAKLAHGIAPYGYPPAPPDRYKHMGRRLAAAGSALGQLLQTLEQAEADLTVARRLHDTTSAGLLLWAESAPLPE